MIFDGILARECFGEAVATMLISSVPVLRVLLDGDVDGGSIA
jgi:hypothetical protein